MVWTETFWNGFVCSTSGFIGFDAIGINGGEGVFLGARGGSIRLEADL